MPLDIKVKRKSTKDVLQIKLNKSISTLESNYYINHICLAYSKIKCLDEICKVILTNKTALFKVEKYQFGCQKISYFDNSYAEWLNIYNSDEAKTFFELFNTFKMPVVYFKKDSSNCIYTTNMETKYLNRDVGNVININSVQTNKSIIPLLTARVGEGRRHNAAERVSNISLRKLTARVGEGIMLLKEFLIFH